MTPRDLAHAYLDKGREDEVLLETLADRSEVADDIFGFHVQQAAEKYLKAVLAVHEVRPPRTHDLAALLSDIEGDGRDIPAEVTVVDEWSPYAVRNRYPFFGSAPILDRRAALEQVRAVRRWAEQVVAEE